MIQDLSIFLDRLHSVNPSARTILTVSPVPLMATLEPRHVLASTTVSKSILRVASDVIERRFENVLYFPSYEIITGAFSRGKYYDTDLRSVREDGVEHVMRLFLAHGTEGGQEEATQKRSVKSELEAYESEISRVVAVMCDEDALAEL